VWAGAVEKKETPMRVSKRLSNRIVLGLAFSIIALTASINGFIIVNSICELEVNMACYHFKGGKVHGMKYFSHESTLLMGRSVESSDRKRDPDKKDDSETVSLNKKSKWLSGLFQQKKKRKENIKKEADNRKGFSKVIASVSSKIDNMRNKNEKNAKEEDIKTFPTDKIDQVKKAIFKEKLKKAEDKVKGIKEEIRKENISDGRRKATDQRDIIKGRSIDQLIRRKAVMQAAKGSKPDARSMQNFKSISSSAGKPRTKMEVKKLKKEKTRVSNDEETKGVASTFSNAQKMLSNVWDSFVSSTEEEWVSVGSKTIISPGRVVPVVAAGLNLLIVASKDGTKLHCIANSCPHLGTPLETGIIERRKIEQKVIKDFKGKTASVEGKKRTSEDDCEECIVCPLHRTAFALESGEVRGEWCPYPPVIGNVMGAVKAKGRLPIIDIRTRGKNIEVRINSVMDIDEIDNPD